MNNRIVKRLLLSALAVVSAFGLCACGVDRAKQSELKETGIKKLEGRQPAEALADFDEAIALAGTKVSPAEVDLCYYKGAAQSMMGDYAAAVATYDGLLTYNEKDEKAYFLRGLARVKTGEVGSAEDDFKKAAELSGTDEMLYYGFSAIMTAGYRDEALKFYEETKDSIKEPASLLYEQIAVYEAAGDFESARNAASQYLALVPDNSEIDREYKFLEMLK